MRNASDMSGAAGSETAERKNLALCAVQLSLSMADLASEGAYRSAIDQAAASAMRAVGDADHRLLVFPENTGHFIPLIHAPRLARSQKTVTRALALMAATRPLRLARAMWSAKVTDLQKGVMLEVAPAADRLMRQIFAAIARRHRAHVVAGSHLRPLESGVTNTSYTFAPDGQLLATTNKVNLVPSLEDSGPGGVDLIRGHAGDLPVVTTPFGKLATLICYDGFRVPHTAHEPYFVHMGQRADALEVAIVANPSANPWPWQAPWIHARGGDRRLRSEQWREEGLASTMAGLRHVRYGITAHLCANLLDLAFEGPSEILARSANLPGRPGRVEVLARARRHDRPEAVVVRVPAPTSGVDLTAAPTASMSV